MINISELKAVEEQVKVAKLNQKLLLPSILPAVSQEPTEALLTQVHPGKYWHFHLFWHSVRVGEAICNQKNGKMTWETV